MKNSKAALKTRGRSEETEEVDSEGSWAISYGDMVTLLLCFFILFFTVDPVRNRQEALQQALMNVFIASSEAPAVSRSVRAPAVASGEVSEPQAEITESWGGKVHKIGNQLVIEFPEVSFFPSGQTKITSEGLKSLKKFTQLFVPFAGTHLISIQAYADSRAVIQKPGRKFSDNLELSALRSVSTMRVLQQSGIPLTRMRVAGFGEMRETVRELAATGNRPLSHFDLARKIVIVVQPEGKARP